MFRFLSEIVLRSKIEKENSSCKKNFLPWDKIEKIALIVSNSENLNKSALDKFIGESKKFIEVFYVETNSKQATYADWQCFIKTDVSFLNLPKNHVTEELKKKKFDLVINTESEDDMFSIALCSALPASFKCGSSSKHNDVGLIIKRNESQNIVDYLRDTVHYLKMIKV